MPDAPEEGFYKFLAEIPPKMIDSFRDNKWSEFFGTYREMRLHYWGTYEPFPYECEYTIVNIKGRLDAAGFYELRDALPDDDIPPQVLIDFGWELEFFHESFPGQWLTLGSREQIQTLMAGWVINGIYLLMLAQQCEKLSHFHRTGRPDED